MDEKEEKIIEALTTLSDYCNSRMGAESCSKCLLGSDSSGCKIIEKTPDHWIIDRPDPVRRLLR